MTRADINGLVEGDIVRATTKDGTAVTISVLRGGDVEVKLSPTRRGTMFSDEDGGGYRYTYDAVDVVSNLQMEPPSIALRTWLPSPYEREATVQALRGAQTFGYELRVCPPCGQGHHEHHGGEDGDCKNLIPSGQCCCWTGAAKKPGREMPKEM